MLADPIYLKIGKTLILLGKQLKPHFEYLLDDYKKDDKDLQVEAEVRKLVTFYADRGSEKAIDVLLEAYKQISSNNKLGLKLIGSETYKIIYDTINFGLKNDPQVQAEGLRLATFYADRGSEKAIAHLLDAYRRGCFGLKNKINYSKGRAGIQLQVEYLRLAKLYADRGSKQAKELIMIDYGVAMSNMLGSLLGLGLDESLHSEVFELVRLYASQGCIVTIISLLKAKFYSVN